MSVLSIAICLVRTAPQTGMKKYGWNWIFFPITWTLCLGLAQKCPEPKKYGYTPKKGCEKAIDPNKLPHTRLQNWFTKQMFETMFPHANHGYGPHPCFPYSYESFIIASRYFPEFGSGRTAKRASGFSVSDLQKRDVAAFFAHVVQETGETRIELFNSSLTQEEAADCFYRGGFYHWYEGGPESKFFHAEKESGKKARRDLKRAGEICTDEGRYCSETVENKFWYSCNSRNLTTDDGNSTIYKGCYFGRGPLQLSWNYNYGQFQHFLKLHQIDVDLLANPNLLITKMDPPLAMLASIWFYMTPQPPKPSMHDIILGNWFPSTKNRRAGYESVFGPTSLVINNECHGEAIEEPGPAGENRRIKAFKWFCNQFGVAPGAERTLSCKGMIEGFDSLRHKLSWQPDWANMWKEQPCDCAPAPYPGALPYYDPKFYPEKFAKQNDQNRLRCVYSMYANPEMFRITKGNSPCIKHRVKIRLTKDGL